MRFLTGVLLVSLSLVACSKKGDTASQQEASTGQPVAAAPVANQQQTQASSAAALNTNKETPGMIDAPTVTPPSAPLPVQPVTNPYASVMPAVVGQVMAKTTFTCEDKTTFATQFESGPNQARVTFSKQEPVILPQAFTPAGFLYKTPQFELSGNGALASWTVVGRKPVRCKALP